ncbi:MAG: hypothetical protein M1833_002058 [Piccolia ochrophora]|nr:MAG: hypothetical protein M1833_002058 [Piccolia ochrophora]
MSKDLDLDLASLWFTKKPVAFPPPSVAGLYPSCNYRLSQTWNARWSMSRWKMILAQTLIIDIQNSNDLSKTTIRLTWDEDNPKRAQALQRHTPPPSPLDPQQLAAAQQRFGDRIARWCERRLGQRVGDGECWTLAHEALQAVAQEDRSRGLEPVMASQGRVHGCRIYVHEVPSKGSAAGGMEVAGVARGDIVEFESARCITEVDVEREHTT